MATDGTQISALPQASTLTGAEKIIVEQGGGTKQSTITEGQQLALTAASTAQSTADNAASNASTALSTANSAASAASSAQSTANSKLSTVAVDGTTVTGDGTIGNPLVADGVIKYVKVHLSVADLLALDTTPKILIPAQGANKIIIPVKLFIQTNFGTAQYSNGSNPVLNTGGMYSQTLANLFTYNQSTLYNFAIPSTTTQFASSSLNINAPYSLTIATALTAGDCTWDVHVAYQVIDIS